MAAVREDESDVCDGVSADYLQSRSFKKLFFKTLGGSVSSSGGNSADGEPADVVSGSGDSDDRTPPPAVRSKEVLHADFMRLVTEMARADCEFPPQLKLYYCVLRHSDRRGKVVQARPFLAKQAAETACGEDEAWEGKYGSDRTYHVVSGGDVAVTDSYPKYECDELRRCDLAFKVDD